MFDFIIDYYPMLLKGTGITILLALLTVVSGTLIGILISILRFNNKGIIGKLLNKLADAYIAFFRGTPLMIQLFIFWFGIPQLCGIRLKPVGFIPAEFIVGAIALAINSGAYVTEIFRAGIQAVEVGQMEAGRSLGLSERKTLKHIILPQAIKNVLPALGNEFVVIIKESAIVSVIGLADLMYNADKVTAATFNAFGVYIVAALIYFLLTSGCSKLVTIFERRLQQDA